MSVIPVVFLCTYLHMYMGFFIGNEFNYIENGNFAIFTEYSYMEKIVNWGKRAQAAGGISQYSCPSYS